MEMALLGLCEEGLEPALLPSEAPAGLWNRLSSFATMLGACLKTWKVSSRVMYYLGTLGESCSKPPWMKRLESMAQQAWRKR